MLAPTLERIRRRTTDARTARLAVALLAFAAAGLDPSRALGQNAPDSTRSKLDATASVPWRPDHSIPSARPWEIVLRAPGQVASIPFALLGQGMKGGLIFVEQHDVVPKVVAQVSVLTQYGLLARPASLGDRTGFGAEAGINPTFLRSLVATASASTNGYNRERVTFQTPYASVAYQSDWRPQEPFFGFGLSSRREDASNYAASSEYARLEVRVPRQRPPVRIAELLDDPAASTETHTPARHLFRAWAGPRDLIVLDGRENTSERPPLATRFPALAASQLGTRVEHFVYGAEAAYDRRSGRPHWWKGWRGSVMAERFDQPLRAFAFHSASTPSVSFTRWTYEGEAGWSFWRDPRTLRIFTRVVDQVGVTGPGLFALPDLASLGGSQGLFGFEPGRFHDADLALSRATYIFPIARYLETDLHAEAGGVAGRLEALRLDEIETSFGIALRVRSPFAPLASAGIDWGRETLRFRFSLGGIE